jgi:hypothetical protein
MAWQWVQQGPVDAYSRDLRPGLTSPDRSTRPGHLSSPGSDRVTRVPPRGPHTRTVPKLISRPLPLHVWLAVPVLFAAAVLGVTGTVGLLLGAEWQATLSLALFGTAAAVTALISVGIEWPRRRRVFVRIAYPLAFFTIGVVVDGTPVPAVVAVLVGLPALVTIGHLCRQERPRRSVVVD